MVKISTSILAANNRIESIKKLNNTTSDYIHLDVMDNVFVPNFQLPIEEVKDLIKYSKIPLDIHLMVKDPVTYINQLNSNKISTITIHLEISKDLYEIIDLIMRKNYKVGIAIKPNTDINLIDKYINIVDYILIMSVEPGFGGQKFIEDSINRIKQIRLKRPNILIGVDGGINIDTIKKVNNIVDIAVVGSYITNKENYQEAINNLKN